MYSSNGLSTIVTLKKIQILLFSAQKIDWNCYALQNPSTSLSQLVMHLELNSFRSRKIIFFNHAGALHVLD
jgi:hypothetical protein